VTQHVTVGESKNTCLEFLILICLFIMQLLHDD